LSNIVAASLNRLEEIFIELGVKYDNLSKTVGFEQMFKQLVVLRKGPEVA